jgi:CDP-glycerol glycerophosphotransferase (TagB/SpsB family)
MPTFRNSKSGVVYPENKISAFPLLSSQDDWDTIDVFCKENDIVLLVKLHMKQKEYNIDFSQFHNIKKISNEDFSNADVQLYEFLAITDGLISDYSSVAVDYLLVDKPIGFALDDFDLYKEARGFVFDNPLEYMPGHHMYSIDDLKKYLSDVASNNDVCKDQRARVRESAVLIKESYSKSIIEELNIVKR